MNYKKYGLKKTYIIILLIFWLFSCNKSEKKKAELKEPVVVAFGFKLNNFDVVNDTIHDGDTFGSILEKQNLGNLKVHEIVEKVKDTFDVRMMRIDKPYTLLRSKDKSKKIRAFIYQPDHLSYYVIDLKDSIKVYKHIEPVTYRRRTIAGKLDGSLSESLVKKGVDGSFAVSISKVYAWSIDFFKLRSRVTERLVVLDWNGNSVRQFENPEQLITEFVQWRLGWYKIRFEKMIADLTYQLNWNLALKACIDGKLPEYLPKAANKSDVVAKVQTLCNGIDIDDDQTDRIAGLPSYRWAKDAYSEIVAKIADLNATIAAHQAVLADPKKQKDLYRKEVLALKKLAKVDR